MKIKLTNEDKTQKLAKKARASLLVSASRDWSFSRECMAKSVALEISALNRLRTCGIKMIEASGHEQVSFEFFRRYSDAIPNDMSFKALKFCVHLARNFDGPIKTIDEARSARQMLFESFGYSSAPKRIDQQSSHEENPWSDFVSAASSFTGLFTKLQTDAMDCWGRDKLSTFVKQTDPIVEANSRAKALL